MPDLQILFDDNEYQLLSDGTFRSYNGKYHGDEYYDLIGNISDVSVLREVLIKVEMKGYKKAQATMRKALGV